MQRFNLKALACATAAALFATLAPTFAAAGQIDAEVLAEVNFARTHPQDYAFELMAQPVSDWERRVRPDGIDDSLAFGEAVEFLLRQAPLAPLRPDDSLAAAALEHVAEQGPAGVIGHASADGERFDARLRRYVPRNTLVAENIAYGPRTAADVVRELIIDKGVADRGHRNNIFHPDVAAAGVACGPHRTFVAMCVIDFAGDPVGGRDLARRQLASLQVSDLAGPGPARAGFLQRLLRRFY
jgi:hypothetical protein